MIVVTDTTPLNYLILIDEIELLPLLFGTVLLPSAASEELRQEETPAKVRGWMTHPPAWLQVRTVITRPNPLLMSLDPGEREAIQLALELGISTVLMDEAKGRQLAQAFHLEVRGTLGILERAAKLGKLDLHPALRKLQQTNFRISPSVLASFLKRNP